MLAPSTQTTISQSADKGGRRRENAAPEANEPEHEKARDQRESWNIKGLSAARREAIVQAAHRNSQSVADFVWDIFEERTKVDRARFFGGAAAMAPSNQADIPRVDIPQISLVEMLDRVPILAAIEPTPGNKAMLRAARAVLREHLEAMRSPRTTSPRLRVAIASPDAREQITAG